MKYIYVFAFLVLASKTSEAQYSCFPPGGPQDGCHGCGGSNDPSGSPNPGDPNWEIPMVRAVDPNEIEGATGFQPGRWVSVRDKLQYTVRFENDPDFATGPAQNVYIRIPVHPRMNLNSLKVTGFGFGSHQYTIPAGSSVYTTQLDLRDSLGLFVNVTAGADITTGEVFWNFNSIDPATHLPPVSGALGFLPINDSMQQDSLPGKGEGYVTFLLTPRETLLTGDTVSEQASIVFDVNDPIATNIWHNTVDAFAPVSHINGFTVINDSIGLHWSGLDDPGGIGLKDYTIYVAENGAPFQVWKTHTTDTQAYFTGLTGSSYHFFSISRDTVNNMEALKNAGEITVSLTGTPLPVTWIYFTGRLQGADARLEWATASELHCRNYVLERSLDGKIFTEIGIIDAKGNTQSNNYGYLDKDIARLNAKHLYYRLRQVMDDNTAAYSPIVMLRLDEAAAETVVTAYPNPFTRTITLQVLYVTASDASDQVSLYSLDGRLRYSRKLRADGYPVVLLDDLPELEQGIYLLKAVINGKQFIVKMLRR